MYSKSLPFEVYLFSSTNSKCLHLQQRSFYLSEIFTLTGIYSLAAQPETSAPSRINMPHTIEQVHAHISALLKKMGVKKQQNFITNKKWHYDTHPGTYTHTLALCLGSSPFICGNTNFLIYLSSIIRCFSSESPILQMSSIQQLEFNLVAVPLVQPQDFNNIHEVLHLLKVLVKMTLQLKVTVFLSRAKTPDTRCSP